MNKNTFIIIHGKESVVIMQNENFLKFVLIYSNLVVYRYFNMEDYEYKRLTYSRPSWYITSPMAWDVDFRWPPNALLQFFLVDQTGSFCRVSDDDTTLLWGLNKGLVVATNAISNSHKREIFVIKNITIV